MKRDRKIVIIGAGVFGLTTALELHQRGFQNIVVLDRQIPPVPDGSSVDISRIIRFDYGDPIYASLAKEAYDLWSTSPAYEGIFFKTPFALVAASQSGRTYVDKCAGVLNEMHVPLETISTREYARSMFPELTGILPQPDLTGYCNFQAGWADAELAILSLRNSCIASGISFISGPHGTITGFESATKSGHITAAKTEAGIIPGDLFILATGAWSSALVPMHGSNLATGQVLAFLKLEENEIERLKNMPIYMNFDSGWFCFPPHQRTGHLKMAIHGHGYTRTESKVPQTDGPSPMGKISTPPTTPLIKRTDFAPVDAVERLRSGLKEILPEMATRAFDQVSVCWYSETPTGDFILDYHPEFSNLFLATGGSGHAFKFLPVLGKYTVASIERLLSKRLLQKWRFRPNPHDSGIVYLGDGSRGGPSRRELDSEERARL